ncbi:S8 family peptidase [Glutamicibacter sp. M10]|uniref:S8 family peptidase n=1 Tax=Glutamicibacter sp. M10 TaxID=3023076 RepID=UPI0021CA76E8|nr:S8 family peptidase [Glutamicibacter sp. M10]UXN32944.1 S8 family peptidase [Glutamicibacter sp. M10]
MARFSTPLRRSLAASTAVVIGLAGLGAGAMPASAQPVTAPAEKSAPAPSNDAKVTIGSPQSGESYDQFIVTYKVSTQSADKQGRAKAWGNAAKEAGVSVKELRAMATGGFVLKADKKLKGADAEEFMAEIAKSGLVEAVEPDALMEISLSPNDTRYSEQWDFHGTNGMRIPSAWDIGTGTGSIVAVLDTGITSHTDLNSNVISGYDFVSSSTSARDGNGRDSNPQDQGDWYAAGECGSSYAGNSSWHGTHVAGTVAAVTGNSSGVAGVAPNAKIQPVRVLAKCGGSLSDIADAIIWASGGTVSGIPANSTPADTINMSLGGGGVCGTTYQAAIDSAVSRGTSVVVAAGNESQNASNSRPANCNNVITVAASNPSGAPSYYTNYGSAVDVTAPGGDTRYAGQGILSTINTGTTTPSSQGYTFYQGTSMATPHVAGMVALMKSVSPSMSPAQVETVLKNGTRAMPGGCSIGCGAGLVDATKIMTNLGGTTPEPTPEPSGNLLKNPGFESGADSWTANRADTFETGTAARTGNGLAGLNGWGTASTYTLDQQVAIPSTATTADLKFYLRVLTDETTASTQYDKLTVQVLDGSSTYNVGTWSNLDASSSYAQKSINLNNYRGKTVTLRFRGVEDSSQATTFRIDDTSLATS